LIGNAAHGFLSKMTNDQVLRRGTRPVSGSA
jgi:hypothetical protein